MSAANVTFEKLGYDPAAPGDEQAFEFDCPKHKRRCGAIVIAGRTTLPRNGQNINGGIAQWDWTNAPNRDAPTFSPSINCGTCWHGFIENGRCVDVSKRDEPDIRGN